MGKQLTILCALGVAAAAILAAAVMMSPAAPPVDIGVKFWLIDHNNQGMPGVSARLVLGDGPGWQKPDAGKRFVTDKQGKAKFEASATLDRRWRTEQYNIPSRNDHLALAVELGDPDQKLYRFDVDCPTTSDCANDDITAVYAEDANGDFTRDVGAGGYSLAGVLLTPDDASKRHWTLEVDLKGK
jgi:hypothetical protein